MLVISHTVFNDRSGTVIALAVTSRPQSADFPLTYELKSGALPRRSWVKISQIRTLSVSRLKGKAGSLEPEELERIIEGVNEIIGG